MCRNEKLFFLFLCPFFNRGKNITGPCPSPKQRLVCFRFFGHSGWYWPSVAPLKSRTTIRRGFNVPVPDQPALNSEEAPDSHACVDTSPSQSS